MVDETHENVIAAEEEPISTPEAEAPEPADLGAPTAKLIVKRSGAPTDVEFTIHPPAVIGRFDPSVGPIDVDLGSLPEGAYVSRKHAKIVLDDGVWKLIDLGSSNGSFVLTGDEFLKIEESEIADGQEFALGNARFTFHLG